MLFSSYSFVFLFLPATLVAFAAARLHSARAGIGVLVAASLYFYAAWRSAFLLLLIGSIAVNFAIGLMMERSERRRAFGLAGVALNLALLAYFKYATFIVGNINAMAGASLSLGDIVLPIGISFFTFQQIAYLVDVMRGTPAERDLLSYTLFVSFFPHLIAGPLVHHADMIPQFKNKRRRRFAVLGARGFAIFVAGLFKKVVIADGFAQFATPAFQHVDAGGAIGMGWAWIAALAYTLQIYFDFSGYSDMAIGLGLMFGIRLPVNFRSPYKARSIIDFWRRWHISLSRFLRDYLYIPLGGNRRGPLRRQVNLMITMLLGGLWHGAGWTFVLWGGLHGLCLVANHLWRSAAGEGTALRAALAHLPSAARQAAAWGATLAALVVAWVIFRAETLAGAGTMLAAMFGLTGEAKGALYAHGGIVRFADLPLVLAPGVDFAMAAVALALGVAIALLLPNTAEIFGYREWRRAPEGASRGAPRWRPTFGWAFVMAAAFTLCVFGMMQRLEFLYFQF